jgi:colanic acid biosynthesis glycosyl transferase WcaI
MDSSTLRSVSSARDRNGHRRPRLLVFNQYYWPGLEATAHLLSELCEALAEDFDIRVVTGMLSHVANEPGVTTRNGVEIVRVRSTSFERTKLTRRAVNYATYVAESLRVGLKEERPDFVLCMTDPPIIADVALLVARRFRAPLIVVSQDVFPEVAVELQRLQSRPIVGFLRLAIRFYLERADRVVAIGETMRRRLEAKGADPERVRVIPNWVDTDALEPQPRDNPWAQEHGLDDRFVVMHSGNVGHAQNLDTLVRAATFLRDLEDLRVVIIGVGARHQDLVNLAEVLEADNVIFLPYQPRALLPSSLSSADVHVVGLARGLSGYVVPSRLYGVLSVGRPVIVTADADSETAQVVERVGCGIAIPPGRPDTLAGEIRRAYEGRLDLEGMGERGREYVVGEADSRVAFERYRQLLWELFESGDGAAGRSRAEVG